MRIRLRVFGAGLVIGFGTTRSPGFVAFQLLFGSAGNEVYLPANYRDVQQAQADAFDRLARSPAPIGPAAAEPTLKERETRK